MTLTLIPTSFTAATNEETDIIIEDHYVEMEDEVKLATRVYRPNDNRQYPILLARTPYNSGAFNNPSGGDYREVGERFAKKGYVVVVQDVRGLFNSEGIYQPYIDDAKDGYDTMLWLHKQPWSNGKIGLFGASARGATATILATQNPPGLEAMYVEITSSQYYEETLFQGGAYRHELITRWLTGVNVSYSKNLLDQGEIDEETYQEIEDVAKEFPNMYWHTPIKSFPYLDQVSTFNDIFLHDTKDGHFNYRDISLHFSDMTVPTYHVGGWYDIYAEGTMKNYLGLQHKGGKGAKGNQKLLMGPWQHRDIGNSPLFEGDEIDLKGEMERWFDYWLKGIDNGIMDEEPIKYYTMGDNEWKTATKWPVQSSTKQKWYFNEEKSGSADSLNDGGLSKKVSRTKEAHEYAYDPAKPNITIGGQNLYDSYGVGPMDQRPAEENSLTYTSDVLEEEVEITGKITATLYVSSDAKDTDFAVKLTDVAPDGTSTLLNDGILRMRFRDGLDKEVFMKDGEVYKIEVNLNDTSHVFKEGHRIRVSVSSSNFPRFDRNPNTGNPFGVDSEDDFVIANNTVHLSPKYSSHISLPVVKNR